jgi:hypothetical protein
MAVGRLGSMSLIMQMTWKGDFTLNDNVGLH